MEIRTLKLAHGIHWIADGFSLFRRNSTLESKSAYPAVMLTIPMQMKRCGFAMRLLIQGPNQARQQLREARLINLIAKAYDWLERLTSG